VAAVALLAIFALVDVIVVMAAIAGFRQGDAGGHRQLMAGIAGDCLVRAIQLEMGARVVIEIPDLP